MLLYIGLVGLPELLAHPEVFLKARDGILMPVILLKAATLVVDEPRVFGGDEEL
jgi:hypothetical protein